MRIEEDIKLDFKDVLIRPKRSTLRSRSQVCLEREFKFVHANTKWKGVPIIAANMDHTGTFEMAHALAQHNMLTATQKFYTEKDWKKALKDNPDILNHCFVSSGIKKEDLDHIA